LECRDDARIAACAAAAGRAVRAFHDAGGHHADLHLKNLLVQPGERVLVIDLDRAKVGDPPPAARRMRELMRLYRSLIKRQVFDRVGARGRAAFFDAYTDGDPQLSAALLEGWPRERRRVARHQRGYRGSGGSVPPRS
jgi:aminoglycoside phosphotransferase (APT) family kinase protein